MITPDLTIVLLDVIDDVPYLKTNGLYSIVKSLDEICRLCGIRVTKDGRIMIDDNLATACPAPLEVRDSSTQTNLSEDFLIRTFEREAQGGAKAETQETGMTCGMCSACPGETEDGEDICQGDWFHEF